MPSCVRRFAGASPLTRGKPARRDREELHRGRIPAHAGKTSSSRATSATYRAHPRSRGENITNFMGWLSDMGASPLTRGKPRSCERSGRGAGRIPAHAGKTRVWRGGPGGGRAHPRSRGENLSGADADHDFAGASPLTRGKPTHSLADPHARGRIPAHAGKTRWETCPPLRTRAHPRSRGENLPIGCS